jgi:hypothetical protein
MPRAPRRPKRCRGKLQSQSRTGQPSPQQGQDQQVGPSKRRRPLSPGTRVSDMAEAIARRYSIEVNDAETGDTLILIAAEWTAEQKGVGVALISQLSGLHEGECGLEIDENEPARGETRHN